MTMIVRKIDMEIQILLLKIGIYYIYSFFLINRTAMDENKFPRLSINFGLFDFIYSPSDAYSFDYYLELKKDIVLNIL